MPCGAHTESRNAFWPTPQPARPAKPLEPLGRNANEISGHPKGPPKGRACSLDKLLAKLTEVVLALGEQSRKAILFVSFQLRAQIKRATDSSGSSGFVFSARSLALYVNFALLVRGSRAQPIRGRRSIWLRRLETLTKSWRESSSSLSSSANDILFASLQETRAAVQLRIRKFANDLALIALRRSLLRWPLGSARRCDKTRKQDHSISMSNVNAVFGLAMIEFQQRKARFK